MRDDGPAGSSKLLDESSHRRGNKTYLYPFGLFLFPTQWAQVNSHRKHVCALPIWEVQEYIPLNARRWTLVEGERHALTNNRRQLKQKPSNRHAISFFRRRGSWLLSLLGSRHACVSNHYFMIWAMISSEGYQWTYCSSFYFRKIMWTLLLYFRVVVLPTMIRADGY